MNRLKSITNIVIWTLIGFFVTVMVLLEIPAVQSFVGKKVAEALSDKLGTEVSVGRIGIGIPNRLTVDDISINDKRHKKMLAANRVSAKIDITALSRKAIIVTSAQLFGLDAHLCHDAVTGEANYQFMLDSLSSKDDTEKTPLNLKINSLVLRRGNIVYDDMKVADLSAHFIVDALKDDSMNIKIKRMAGTLFKQHYNHDETIEYGDNQGVRVVSLKAHVVANTTRATLSDFMLQLPHSTIIITDCKASYRMIDGKLQPSTLQYATELEKTVIRPSDLSSLLPSLDDFNNDIHLKGSLSGTANTMLVNGLDLFSDDKSLIVKGMFTLDNGQSLFSSPYPFSQSNWSADINNSHISADLVQKIANIAQPKIKVPQEILRLGSIGYVGSISGSSSEIAIDGLLRTDAGDASLVIEKNGTYFTGKLSTTGINLQQILADNKFGQLITDINVEGQTNGNTFNNITLKGQISHIDYDGYPYSNISIDGTLADKTFDGKLSANDPNAQFELQGSFTLASTLSQANLQANVRQLNPNAIHLTGKWPETVFSGSVIADVTGRTLSTLNGTIDIANFKMQRFGATQNHSTSDMQSQELSDNLPANNEKNIYSLSHFLLTAHNTPQQQSLTLESDFASLHLTGRYDYTTISQSINNIIANKLPTLPGLSDRRTHPTNHFTIDATIKKADFFNEVLDIPVAMTQPVTLTGIINDYTNILNVQAEVPDITYNNSNYTNGKIDISSPNNTLTASISFDKPQANGNNFAWCIDAVAADNTLSANISFDNHGANRLKGSLNADAQFFKTEVGTSTAHIDLHTSEILIGDTVWTVMPGNIIYSENNLLLDHIAVRHGQQHIIIDGHATKLNTDSVTVDIKEVDVAYILDFVNFRSVNFGGIATGKVYLSNVFDTPKASADLQVDNFTFQQGNMGTLYVKANYNNNSQQIDIDAKAKESPLAQTLIKGYISPQRKALDLDIHAQNTSIEFMEGFMSTLLCDVNASAEGRVNLVGDFKHINLLGSAVVNGTIGISPLNTTYRLSNDTINLYQNSMVFSNDTIYDLEGHHAIVDGTIRHSYLKNMTYDVDVNAYNLFAYNHPDFGEDTFCGMVWSSGSCKIRGKSGEVVIDVDAYPERGSVVSYNAASPDAISKQEFIQWNTKHEDTTATGEYNYDNSDRATATVYTSSLASNKVPITSNIHINFLIHATPLSTLNVLMDEATGDHIALNGEGVLRATYYNKGAFQMYGNYLVDHGIYKLTIQNIIRKEFLFQPGGTIAFRGDPYNAALNLKALYTINGVSLADLNIGHSFKSNNIRVNCLMDIVGTPYQPRVEFSLDMPTIGSEAKNMIFSLINSEQEMNQQVLYLLAIGRFYNQGANNATSDGSPQQSQTSLAMQSILSGTISQQINNVLSSFVNNSNWNFGANISTGDEGFNNAEYEGLLSGRLLNNRLLINGEFGYRDNPNATTSFIGDFDIRYLLTPNGNAAIKVYNQTNDRYFTRNSLNTQGVGLILKKDFNGWKDFWRISRKKKK